jgi:hypothetical protein
VAAAERNRGGGCGSAAAAAGPPAPRRLQAGVLETAGGTRATAAGPNRRCVPIGTIEQQGRLALHRVRALLVQQRTSAVTALRGLLSEFGILAAKGIRRVEELRERMRAASRMYCRARHARPSASCLIIWTACTNGATRSQPGYWPGIRPAKPAADWLWHLVSDL